MSQSDIRRELEDKKDDLDHLTIILKDGERVHGRLAGLTWESGNSRESPWRSDNSYEAEQDSIVVQYNSGKYTFIPILKARAIFPSYFSQKQNRDAKASAKDWTAPIIKRKREETNKTIRKHNLRTNLIAISCSSSSLETPSFDWGATQYTDYTQIYADIDYFERKRSVTDIGITILGFGISIGGDRDTDKEAKKRLNRRNYSPIDSINSTMDRVTTVGKPHRLESSRDNLERKMENKKWAPYVFSDQNVSDINDIDDKNWCLCWFAQEWFHVPPEYALETDQEIRIFGELIHSPIRTEFGEMDWTIKCRAAAYCGD